MTVPGVGPSTAVRFVAAIDDITRFDSAHKSSPTWARPWRELEPPSDNSA